jgi:serine/threonine protein kinase
MKTCIICGSQIYDDNVDVCPSCGNTLNLDEQEIYSDALPQGTMLNNGKVKITRCIGQGGFGITYEGVFLNGGQNLRCVIKEFFISGCSRRVGKNVIKPPTYEITTVEYESFKKRFYEEAEVLKMLSKNKMISDTIPNVYDVFEENNTVYYVMDYIEGKTIDKIVEEKGPFDEETAFNYILQICSILKVVHNHNLIHRDIKPQNIVVDEQNKKVYLIDFGSARKFVQGKTSAHTVLVSNGFAAPEQYSPHGRFGPQVDIYAIGVTLYYMLTGEMPESALDRISSDKLTPPKKIKPELLEKTQNIILKCLEIKVEKRYPNVNELENDIKEAKNLLMSTHDKKWFNFGFSISEVEQFVSLGLGPEEAYEWTKICKSKKDALELAKKWVKFVKDAKVVSKWREQWRKYLSEKQNYYFYVDNELENFESEEKIQLLTKKLVEKRISPEKFGKKLCKKYKSFMFKEEFFYDGIKRYLYNNVPMKQMFKELRKFSFYTFILKIWPYIFFWFIYLFLGPSIVLYTASFVTGYKIDSLYLLPFISHMLFAFYFVIGLVTSTVNITAYVENLLTGKNFNKTYFFILSKTKDKFCTATFLLFWLLTIIIFLIPKFVYKKLKQFSHQRGIS